VRPLAFIAAGVLLLTLPRVEWGRVDTTGSATAAVYVYEKDDGGVPPFVTVAVNRLNRERKVVATLLEADTTDGTGDVPEQYQAVLDAARKAGLPAVVALAGRTVIRVTPQPASEAAVMEAVP
jgi:hypothetical protein